MTEEKRRDAALILAGGDSRRMGRPKGLCRHGADPRPLLERVAALYMEQGMPVVVAATAALVRTYRDVLPEDGVTWATRPPGGGTAATVAAGMRVMENEASHVWLHPVDLPFVRPATLHLLLEYSRTRPETIVVPRFGSDPGHPVVLPVAAWPRTTRLDDARSMRALIASGQRSPLEIEVPDPGVVRDLDRPEDLDSQGEH